MLSSADDPAYSVYRIYKISYMCRQMIDDPVQSDLFVNGNRKYDSKKQAYTSLYHFMFFMCRKTFFERDFLHSTVH